MDARREPRAARADRPRRPRSDDRRDPQGARLLAKDRATSTVRTPFTRFEDDAGPGQVSAGARGRRVRRAFGELIVCPYCLGLWAAALFAAGFAVAPRATRWIASVLTAHFESDALHIAYKKSENSM